MEVERKHKVGCEHTGECKAVDETNIPDNIQAQIPERRLQPWFPDTTVPFVEA